MSKSSSKERTGLPKTGSADRATGVANANEGRHERKVADSKSDEGIRPDDLNSENDQGAS